MDPIISFLKEDTLPSDKLEVEKIRSEAPRFWLSEDQKLYKRSFSGPFLLCIHPETLDLLLEELHEGIAEVTREEDLYLIELSRKAIGGQTCRKKHKSM